MINSGTPDTDLQSLSLHHDDVCKAAASWTHPKRVGGHLGAARCGRQRLPSHIGLPSGTRHTVDAFLRNAFLLCATGYRTHDSQQIAPLPDEVVHVSHNTLIHF